MQKRPAKLSATFVKTISKAGVYGDGRGGFGLYLRVRTTANGRIGRSWGQRVRIGGRVTNVGLGSYPIVTLAEARKAALANRRALAKGQDPRGEGIPTFAQAAEKVIRLHRANWKPGSSSEGQWRSSLRTYAFPKLGPKRVDKITSADVLGVLMPIWNEKRTIAARVQNRIAAVMKWAIAANYRADNPAGDPIAAALPKKTRATVHHAAVPHRDVGAALAKLRDGTIPGLCLELIILTAVRSGEARGARWEEIDLEASVWTVPAARMKTGREHRVPLSSRALEVLYEAQALGRGSSELVFPSRGDTPLNRTVLWRKLRQHEVPGTVHGFRSSFRDWAAERGIARELAEASLAHVVGGVEGAYFRSDLFERRREVMEAWADYVG